MASASSTSAAAAAAVTISASACAAAYSAGSGAPVQPRSAGIAAMHAGSCMHSMYHKLIDLESDDTNLWAQALGVGWIGQQQCYEAFLAACNARRLTGLHWLRREDCVDLVKASWVGTGPRKNRR